MSIRPETDELIDFLNDLVVADPEFMHTLASMKVPCNEQLVDHETVQVGTVGGATVSSLVGVLNGFCGAHDSGPNAGWGAIAAVYNIDGKLQRFVKLDA